jgi:hypothetical protein
LSSDRTDFDPLIADDVRKILNGLATIVEGIGALGTDGGDAHASESGYARVDSRIASLAIHAASRVAPDHVRRIRPPVASSRAMIAQWMST